MWYVQVTLRIFPLDTSNGNQTLHEVQVTGKLVRNGFLRHTLGLKSNHVTKFAFSRKLMAILVFLEDLMKNIKAWIN